MAEQRNVLMYDFQGSICCQMVRLTLVEKGVAYERRQVDISERREQFEAWYVEINPKAVVPTLQIDGELVRDTMLIVDRIDSDFEGPSLTPLDDAGRERTQAWKRDIMDLHYGVLLYSRNLPNDRVHPRIAERGRNLIRMRQERPEAAALLDARIEGNRRFQATLADPAAVEAHVESARALVRRIDPALKANAFLTGKDYGLADAFATAALARLDLHGFSNWWSGGALPEVEAYYERMQARPSFRVAEVDRG